jgi:hypothetical protein
MGPVIMVEIVEHPYKELEQTDLWKIVDRMITELEENTDLKLTTPREYVVGYICTQLADAGLSEPTST